MIQFLDGPAAGVGLRLMRAPIVLRAVKKPRARNWDALDQLDDEPEPEEQIVVYVLATNVGSYHLCIRGKGKKAGGFYLQAGYRVLWRQPADADIRTKEAWEAWCKLEEPRLRDFHQALLKQRGLDAEPREHDDA